MLWNVWKDGDVKIKKENFPNKENASQEFVACAVLLEKVVSVSHVSFILSIQKYICIRWSSPRPQLSLRKLDPPYRIFLFLFFKLPKSENLFPPPGLDCTYKTCWNTLAFQFLIRKCWKRFANYLRNLLFSLNMNQRGGIHENVFEEIAT